MLATVVPVWAEERVPAIVRATHPMDALTPDEITASAKILRAAGKLGDTARIVSLTLEEPAKADVRAWTKGKPFGRRAFAVVLTGGKVGEARVDLDAQALVAWSPVENRQAAVTLEEFLSVTDIVKADDRWRAAMAKRGITDFSNILCLPLSTGPMLDPALAGRRLLNVPCVDKSGTGNNLWGKPIENLMAMVDVAAGRVLSVTDLGIVPPPPETPSHAWVDSDRARAVSKPVEIAAPNGSNISVTGGEVRWDNWSFHVRLDPRLAPSCRLSAMTTTVRRAMSPIRCRRARCSCPTWIPPRPGRSVPTWTSANTDLACSQRNCGRARIARQARRFSI
jgi:primary-amine oxidase